MNKLYAKFVFLAVSVVVAWVLIESAFYYIALGAQKNYTLGLLKEAERSYKEIENIRNWNSKHNGVYLQSATLQPSPYLKDNLVDNEEGKRFVKIDPAWMTRMLSEQHNNEFYSFKLVSLTPINPLSEATGFYKEALERLKNTHENSFEQQYRLDKTAKRLHYLRPVYVEESCLKCHAQYGDKLGDICGGMALNLDAGFYVERMNDAWAKFYGISVLFGLLTLILLYFIRSLAILSDSYERLSNRLKIEAKSQAREFDLALEGSGLGYWRWNIKTNAHDVDSRWLSMLGLSESDVLYSIKDLKERMYSDDLTKIMPIINKAIKTKEPYVVEFRMRHKDGHYVWIQGSGAVINVDEDEEALELSGTHQDISQRKKMELEHQKNELYLNTLFDKNPNIIIVTDGHKIIKANDAFLRFFSEYNSLAEFLQEHNCICNFFEASEFEDTILGVEGEWIKDVFAASEPIVKIRYGHKEYYFAVYAKKIYENGAMHEMVTFSDITETYKLKHEFEALSIMDALTQVYNRRYFNEMFPKELNRAKRAEQSFCFAIMDVDNFKLYNDTYGHDFGDVALQSIAKKLSQSLQRSNEFFFRLGGEEFGIIFSAYSKEESLKYVQNLCKEIQMLEIEHSKNIPYGVLTVSLGLCYVDASANVNTKVVYSIADSALYEAKNKGRNRVILSNSLSRT